MLMNTSDCFLKVPTCRKYGSGVGLLHRWLLLLGSSPGSPGGLEADSVLPWWMSSGQGCQGWDPTASSHGPGSGPDRPGLL